MSGTLYLRARNYNAAIGRFTQEDPIRDGENWYSYCASDPVNAIDPEGEKLIRDTSTYVNDSGGGSKSNKKTETSSQNSKKPNDNKTNNNFFESIGSFFKNVWSGIKNFFRLFEKAEKYEKIINSIDQVLTVNDYVKYINNFYTHYDNMKKSLFVALYCVWGFARYGDKFETSYLDSEAFTKRANYMENIKNCASLFATYANYVDSTGRGKEILTHDFFSLEDYNYMYNNCGAFGVSSSIIPSNWVYDFASISVIDYVNLLTPCLP